MTNIIKKILVIDLKSDLICGSGEGWGNIIDTDITYDKMGFPYIPSRRIKGLLKEAALELEQFDIIKEEDLEKIFGNDENEGCHFIIRNGLLKNIDKMKFEIENMHKKYINYVKPLYVLNYYTTVRYQTSIDENGIAKVNTLRSSRAISGGNTFYAKIEYDEKNQDIIKKCITMIHHMGINRTRGFGEIDLSLIDYVENHEDITDKIATINQESLDDEKEYEIKLYLENEEQLSLPSTNGEKSLDYIPGSAMLGYFANKYLKENKINDLNLFYDLFVKGQLKFSNAYISDEAWNEYIPVRESLYKVKTKDVYIDKAVNDSGEILSKVKNKYISNNKIKEVEKEIVYHHRRPDDKSIGHVINNEKAGNGVFYQLEVIRSHQRFISSIRGKGKYLKIILNNLSPYIQIGKSKHTQYGNVHVCDIKFRLLEEETISSGSEVVITLKSHLLFLDNKQESQLDVSILAQKLNITNAQYFISYEKVGGYNSKWKLQKPSYVAFGAGSCIVGTLTKNLAIESIGDLTHEGLGEFVVQKKSDIHDNKIEKYENKNTIHDCIPNFTKDIVSTSLKHELRLKAFDMFDCIPIEDVMNNTFIGRVLKACRTLSWGEFNKQIQKISNVKKSKAIIKIVKIIVDKCDSLLEGIDILEEYYPQDFYKQTCIDYFTHVKIERRIVK